MHYSIRCRLSDLIYEKTVVSEMKFWAKNNRWYFQGKTYVHEATGQGRILQPILFLKPEQEKCCEKEVHVFESCMRERAHYRKTITADQNHIWPLLGP